MLYRIQQILVEELNKKISELEEEKDKYRRHNLYNEEEFIELNDEINKIDHTSIINKILHFGTMRKRRKEIISEMNEYTEMFYEENRENIKKIESKIKNLQEKIERIKEAKTLFDLGFTSKEKFIKFMKERNIEYTTEDIISSNMTYFFEDSKFMEEALDVDNNNYKYDRTNSIKILKKFLSEQVKSSTDNMSGILQQEAIINLLSKLDDDKFLEDETNRKLIKYIEDYIKRKLTLNEPFYYTIDFDKLKMVYESPAGQELERLFIDESIILGIHGTDYYKEGEENSIFKDGLKNSTQDDRAINDLSRTVAYNLSFIEYLEYDGEEYAGAKILRYNYIVAVPNDSSAPIWGSNEEESTNNYLLPEYVCGVIDTKNRSELIPNMVEDKTSYDIKYADGSIVPLSTKQK